MAKKEVKDKSKLERPFLFPLRFTKEERIQFARDAKKVGLKRNPFALHKLFGYTVESLRGPNLRLKNPQSNAA